MFSYFLIKKKNNSRFKMESGTKTEKKKTILPKSVIERYHQYRNPYNLKKTNILGVVFEIDQRYEILDSSKNKYKIKHKMNNKN